MAGNPNLSVLLTTHTKPEYLEELLEKLLTFELDDTEIIVINDGADAATTRSIQLLLDMHPHDRAYYFEHSETRGRAICLNEGLLQAEGTYIWAPQRAERLNRQLLKEVLHKSTTDPAAVWTLDHTLPATRQGWIDAIEAGNLPGDNCFLFNREAIPPQQLYFNPALQRNLACELALRVIQNKPHQKTDSFFVVEKSPGPIPGPREKQELLLSLLRLSAHPGERLSTLDQIRQIDLEPADEDEKSDIERLHQAAEEDPRTALEQVDSYLRQHPGHYEALKLKVNLLEKLRRHVEAAELKYDLSKIRSSGQADQAPVRQSGLFGTDKERAQNDGKRSPKNIRLSIVIPTAGNGKPFLEECLVRLDEICDPATTELIVIDNASIDDTFDYLRQLREENFLNIRVITNPVNAGFGASANQGIDAANGTYVLLMHNDLLLNAEALQTMLMQMEANPYLGAVGPAVDQCDAEHQLVSAHSADSSARADDPAHTDDPARASEPHNTAGSDDASRSSSTDGYIETEWIDSCCMLMRADSGVRFSDSYGLAFYEDRDFCRRMAEAGYYVAVAPKASVRHHHRQTTGPMGLHLVSGYHLNNLDIFNAKWGQSPDLKAPVQGDVADRINQFPLPVNPSNPPGYWLEMVDEFLTAEAKTEIQNRELEVPTLIKLIRILMAADKRDLLRETETRVIDEELPVDLVRALIDYYYRRNIYSRCRLYLERPESKGLFYDYYRLRISVAEKEPEQAADLLTPLMEKFPCHPGLYRLAGQIHHMSGNEGEAKSFYALAEQIEPSRSSESDSEEVFQIKY